MNLSRTIEYAVQAGRARIASFERLFPLTRFRATESGIDCRVFGVVTSVPTLVPIASWLAVAISGAWITGVFWCDVATSQLAVLTRAKAGHECRESCHGLWFFLAKMPGKPLVTVGERCRKLKFFLRFHQDPSMSSSKQRV